MDWGRGEVTPPNYSFALNQFAPFYPGNSLAAIREQRGQGKLLERRGFLRTLRFELSHQRYRFPIIVQARGDQITDFFSPLPSYFLHDVFHQSLINRLGKQDIYLHRDGHAFYQWQDQRRALTHSYAGACTITCFPLYYSVQLSNPPKNTGSRTILESARIYEDF